MPLHAQLGEPHNWIKGCKGADAGKEERQTVLRELARYRNASSSTIEDIARGITWLIVEIFSRQAAVQIIQGRYFDGHPLLYRDLEDELEEMTQTLEDGVAVLNEYLATREVSLKAYGMTEDKSPTQLTIDLDRIKGDAKERIAADRAGRWIRYSKQKATAGILEATAGHETYMAHEWNRLRDIFEVEP